MNNVICILFFILPAIASEQKEPHRHSHGRRTHDVIINIETPPALQQQNELMEQHRNELKKTKIKVAAITTIATGLITAGIALLWHYSTGGCAK